MFRYLTNNYRKMHHLPKFRRFKVKVKYRDGNVIRHGVRNCMMDEQSRRELQMHECDAFSPFLDFYKSFIGGKQ